MTREKFEFKSLARGGTLKNDVKYQIWLILLEPKQTKTEGCYASTLPSPSPLS